MVKNKWFKERSLNWLVYLSNKQIGKIKFIKMVIIVFSIDVYQTVGSCLDLG